MTVTPTGFQAVHVAGLETLISECAAFQSWVGAANASEAMASIYVEAFDTSENLASHRPFCLIGIGPCESHERAARSHFLTTAEYSLVFEDDIDPSNLANPRDAGFAFLNSVNAIIAEMQTDSDGTNDAGEPHVRISSFSQAQGPGRLEPLRGEVDGNAFIVEWTVQMGWAE